MLQRFVTCCALIVCSSAYSLDSVEPTQCHQVAKYAMAITQMSLIGMKREDVEEFAASKDTPFLPTAELRADVFESRFEYPYEAHNVYLELCQSEGFENFKRVLRERKVLRMMK